MQTDETFKLPLLNYQKFELTIFCFRNICRNFVSIDQQKRN